MTIEDNVKEAILGWNEEQLKEICRSSIENSETTPEALLKIIGNIMQFLGKEFEREEIFLPDLIGFASTVKAAIDDVLDPAIRAGGKQRKSLGRIVIGTVESDIHSIGKDLVASFLFSNGFEVFNLGVDVPASIFVEKAEEVNAQAIGLSSLLTMSMDFQKEVIKLLEEKGIRKKYKVIVGGSPTSEEWAETIGADGWADDAIGAVLLLKKLMGIKK